MVAAVTDPYRDYHPNLDESIQRLMHDELDSIGVLFNSLPAHYGGVFGFALFDSKGDIHTGHTACFPQEGDVINAAIGLMDITRRVMLGEYGDDAS